MHFEFDCFFQIRLYTFSSESFVRMFPWKRVSGLLISHQEVVCMIGFRIWMLLLTLLLNIYILNTVLCWGEKVSRNGFAYDLVLDRFCVHIVLLC